ncbi:MAG: alpha/beta fold hydrolase [Rhodospirillaceae bacterium]
MAKSVKSNTENIVEFQSPQGKTKPKNLINDSQVAIDNLDQSAMLWPSIYTKWLSEVGAASWPGQYYSWLPEIFKAGEQTVSCAPACPEESDSTYLDGPASIDRLLQASVAKATLGLSPASLFLAYIDWAIHLAMAPGKQQQLFQKALRKAARFGTYALRAAAHTETPPCIAPLPQDRRFSHPGWQRWPHNLIHQSFLLSQQWWHNATTGVPGVEGHHQNVVTFSGRQLLDVFSPSNFLFTNPELIEVTTEEGGQNLIRGAVNFVEDWERVVAGRPPVGSEKIRVGEDVAVTPGQVVYRNHLIELIQYAPQTVKVYAEPVLIVPAWIMKYYILDLSPENSLVRYLVAQGHTVFMISWRNPTAADRSLSMEDYLRLGIYDAMTAVGSIVPKRPVNAVGYCLGGTLLAIAAAAMARDKDDRFKTISLLAAQIDFTEAGELTLFIDPSQLTFLEAMMWDQGYLDAKQMAGAFQMLRSNDLIWSRMLRDYLLGRRGPLTDLMAWNADATRMPYKMHSEYLRKLFFNNDFAEGRYKVGDRPVSFSDIRAPVFVVGTENDHVAPWASVYKIHREADTDVTFVLTSGGHNAGIISEPGHARRHFRKTHTAHDSQFIDPQTWFDATKPEDGSWWPTWNAWLADHSEGKGDPPPLGSPDVNLKPLTKAPGTYVLQTSVA